MADSMQFPTSDEHVLTCGNTTIGVINDICLVSQFQVGSWQVLYRPMETGNRRRWGMPLMIPNFSWLKNDTFEEKGTKLPMHGFGRTLPWPVTAEDASHLTMQLQSSAATLPAYPYEFTFIAEVAAGEGTLTYTLTMENSSDEVMPVAPGFHPYFALAQQDKAQLVVSGLPGFNASAINWNTSPPDNAYPFPHHVTIQFPAAGTLTIEEIPVNRQYALANMQVWSEPADKPDSNFVCFEPTVGSADALNRPTARLNIAPHASRQLILRLTAKPS